MSFKIVLLEDRYENHEPEIKIFSRDGNRIIEVRDLADSDKAEEICRDADALLVNLYPVDRSFISKLEKCRVISRYGIGYDNIDVAAASEKGIKVTNVPGYCAEEVAEHIIALVFCCIRNITERNRNIRLGKWNIKNGVPVHRFSGRKFGIIGYGQTGQALHRKLCCLGLEEIAVYDHHSDKKEKQLKENTLNSGKSGFKSFIEILEESDFISINIPLNAETKHFIGKNELSRMKKTAVLINTARGGIVDTEALVHALKNSIIAGAGLDVYETEPLPADSLLLELDNTVLTDHAAWYSIESQADLQRKCAEAAYSVLTGNYCSSIVNKTEGMS